MLAIFKLKNMIIRFFVSFFIVIFFRKDKILDNNELEILVED